MIAILSRRPDISFETFRHHYETSHVPLVKALMGDSLSAYVRNYRNARANPFPVGPGAEFDCVTEFHFADEAAFRTAVAAIEHPDNAPLVRADEAKFLDTGRVLIAMVDVATRTDGVDRWTTPAT
jgi:uncharacterized protein (TIGR02118 family)